MAKYFLFILLAFFLFINILNPLEKELKETLKKKQLLYYKLEKQKFYLNNEKLVNKILLRQTDTLSKSTNMFFDKKDKQTLVFSKIQSYIQSIVKDAKITQLHTGVVIEKNNYYQYPVVLDLRIIPEDLNIFFRNIFNSKYYFSIDSLKIVSLKRESLLRLKITFIGYQLK